MSTVATAAKQIAVVTDDTARLELIIQAHRGLRTQLAGARHRPLRQDARDAVLLHG